MTKKMLTIKEKYIVMQYIEEHCTRPPDHTYAMYDTIAKNDQHVADLHKPSIPNINAGHVTKMRQELGLYLEPIRVGKARTIDELQVKVEQLEAIIQDHGQRIAALEDKYTSPKAHSPQIAEYVPTSDMIFGAKPIDKWLERAADKAVMAVIDPLVEKAHPVRLHRKGKHANGR